MQCLHVSSVDNVAVSRLCDTPLLSIACRRPSYGLISVGHAGGLGLP